MRRTCSLFLIAFLLFPALVISAQEEQTPPETPDSPPIDSEWSAYDPTLYTRGDKTFNITLGAVLPAFFAGKVVNQKGMLSVGGTGSLAFNYFLSPYFFLGGELGGMFSSSRGGTMYYAIPFGVHAGVQFLFRRFEFPLTFMVGAAPQKYLDKEYFGLILKSGASAFWRFNPDWSFGVNGIWWFLPQWPKNGNNAYGNFVEVTLSARYHF